MGQRLVITVTKDDIDVCAIYYHWSAYTMSSLFELKDLLEFIHGKTFPDKATLQLSLIKFCENNGGGIYPGKNNKECTYIHKQFPDEHFLNTVNRNCGMIAISDDGIQELRSWSEGDIYIDMDTTIVDFNVLFSYASLEDYEYITGENFTEDDNNSIDEIACYIDRFAFDDIDSVIQTLKDTRSRFLRYGETLYELID